MPGALKLVVPLLLIPILRASAVPCSSDDLREDTNDVGAYYKCNNGIQTHHQCPPGTIFDVNELNCANGSLKVERSRRSVTDELKIVCYYVSWGIYKDELGKFEPENIDPFLCTHIIYAFAKLDDASYTIKPGNVHADLMEKSYEKVVSLKKKNPKLRVLLAIGGWEESKEDKYSKLVDNPELRKKFIKHVITFLKQRGFDGLDLDWEFPVCWQADCSKGPTNDKENFSAFVKELRKAFDDEKPRLLLSADVSASEFIANKSYDIKSISQNLDFINVMTYYFHSAAEGKTGHHSAFRVPKNEYSINVVCSMKYWEKQDVPKKKLILGIPAFGTTFKLVDANQHGLGATTNGQGDPGDYTNIAGTLAFYEILENLRDKGWKMERDLDAGPYAYGEGQWVGYDDQISCKQKAKFVKDSGYGGVVISELSSDDFRGKWANRPYPLLNSVKEAYAGGTMLKGNCIIFVSTVILIVKICAKF